ncbi:FkbM family methyltransferase [Mesorhizobium opportunistum]|uniref:Methyltransferase FkbM family n=1 Tax=Mesorhizobium opportunistum (strain LMG 24607 / HAMBI 3007 / WSM2075) TaxID=536019 RepID=F7XZX9_MESOW|nr:FkbM family methyltransferase [Mesorhizobium opportunistum]AEH88193.1 methyltransferase FkbM family [Mesorhizobium opportunistum WSM2075]
MTGHRDQWFGGRTYAQHGDDLAVLNIFHRLGIEKPSYLDVGAYHPFTLSNTALLYERGSRGINVEPNETLFAEFVKARPEDANILSGVAPICGRLPFHHVAADPGRFTFDLATAKTLGIVHSVDMPVMTLNQIVDCWCKGIWPDLLTIDIEGLDIDVLQDADFGDNPPRVVIVEADNGSGDTSHELDALMHAKGFTLHSWCGSNMIFVRVADADRIW